MATPKTLLPDLDLARIRCYAKGASQPAVDAVPDRLHRYDRIGSSPPVDPRLAEIEADPTSIFWG